MTDRLTHVNPKFAEAQRMGYNTRGIKEFIHLFTLDGSDNLFIPRGMRNDLMQLISQLKLTTSVEDSRNFKPVSNYVDGSAIKFRPYQSPAINNLLNSGPEGVLVSPAGSGKTVMGLSLIPITQQPTLWLTHTDRLFKQCYERCKEFLPGIASDSIGLIGGGKWSVGSILTIAMVPTLVQNLEKTAELKNAFGSVVVDECLIAGTKILMLDGTERNIEKVQNGEITTFGKITNKFKRITSHVVKLRCSVGTLVGTKTHKLPYISKTSLKLNNLKDRYIPFNDNDVCFSTMSEINKKDFLLINESSQCLTMLMQETNVYKRLVKFRNRYYRCVPVIEKEVIEEETTVYDFTTDQHLFIANGILSSNCHHVPSTTFTKVISLLNPYFMYGLTATPYRRDKLESLLFQCLGPIGAVVDKKEVASHKGMIPPTIVYCGINHGPQVDIASIPIIFKEFIIDNDKRNTRIKNDVIREAKKGNFCIVASGRKAHCETLHRLISAEWPKTGIATGKYSKKHVDTQVAAFDNKEITVLVTTPELLGEGFDVDFLNRLFLATSFRTETRAEQLVGRIQRYHPDKKDSWVYDYVDENIGVLQNQYFSRHGACRHSVYKRLGLRTVKYEDLLM